MKIVRAVQATQAGWSVTIIRIVLGVIFFREGSGKLFAWFGGEGFLGTCAYFLQLGIPFPEFNTYLVGWAEFLSGLSLLSGFLTRLATIPISITMVVAIVTAHLAGGWSYPLLIIASCFLLLHLGGGPFSLDRLFSKKI